MRKKKYYIQKKDGDKVRAYQRKYMKKWRAEKKKKEVATAYKNPTISTEIG